ncbi:MAG: molybdopterin converting factor subunit 1 [Pseudomonadota bacterium]
MLKVLYFASLRELIGVAHEEVALPVNPTVSGLVEVLRARGGHYAEALSASKRWRVAVNQDMASLTDPVKTGDEIAIFPPVTGG